MAHGFSKIVVGSESDDETEDTSPNTLIPGVNSTHEEAARHFVIAAPVSATASLLSPTVHSALVQPSGRLTTPQVFEIDRDESATTKSRGVTSAAGDYFTANAMTSHSIGAAGITPTAAQFSGLTESPRPESIQMPISDPTSSRRPSLPRETLSDTSTATVVPEALSLVRARNQPQRSYTEYPQYPNQSLAALQLQKHPERYRPSWLSRPLPLQPPSAISLPGYVPHEEAASREYRTAGNTPIHSPGLFTHRFMHRPVTLEVADNKTPLQSPYLHPMQQQTQPPPHKETNTADRAVDWLTGRKMINQYEIYYELGAGVHGKVKLARNLETGKLVAIKIVRRYSKRRRLGKAASNAEDKVKKELAILKKVHHPNIVTMLEVIDDPEMTKVYIVLEFCEKREIDWRIEGTPEIVILENRRLEREAQHFVDANVHKRESRLLKAAEKRGKQPNRRRQQMGNDGSLENTTGSDVDDSEIEETGHDSPPASRALSNPLGPDIDLFENPGDLGFHDSFGPVVSQAGVRDPITNNESEEHIVGPKSGTRRPLSDANLNSQSQSFPSLWLDEIPHRVDVDGNYHDRRQRSPESTLIRITALMNHEVPKESQYVPTMAIAESRFAFRDALLGLEYLHYHGIVHRDIKPANLLRTKDSRVKISDFGVSYLGKPVRESDSEPLSETENYDVEEETELAKTVGTPSFYAPELCSLDFVGEMPAVTGQIDVWALGVTLYCILFGRTPFTAENEFALMKCIAEDEVFIPRKRLKAVPKPPEKPIKESDENPGGEPIEHLDHEILEDSSSPDPPEILLSLPKDDQRLPTQWVHDDIDDELYDLLNRLLIKDPSKRITLREVKHHPWVLQDIMGQHVAWLDETDPARHTEGKKIEITKEEVADAVIPLKVMERARSIVKKVGGAVGGAFGIRGRNPRKRAKSSAASSENAAEPSISPASPSAASKSAKRSSLRYANDQIESAWKAPREQQDEHPLSQSFMADTGDLDYQDELSTAKRIPRPQPLPYSSTSQRPTMPERQTSTAGSIKTIRQSDIDRIHLKPSPTLSQDLPGYQITTEPHDAPTVEALRDEANQSSRRAMRSRERETMGRYLEHDLVAFGNMTATEVLYGAPRIALSEASVVGHMNVHSTLGDNAAESARGTLTSSRSDSVTAFSKSLDTPPQENDANGPSILPMPHSPSPPRMNTVNIAGALSQVESDYHPPDHEPTDEEWRIAKATLFRRTRLEFEHEREHLRMSRPGSAMGPDACPPSPDDDEYQTQQLASAATSPRSTRDFFAEMSPRTKMAAFTMQPVSSSSSHDRLTSLSQSSTSFPSMPSVLTAESSVMPESRSTDNLKDDVSSDGTTHGFVSTPVKPVSLGKSNTTRVETRSKAPHEGGNPAYGYDADETAVQTDEDDSGSESEALHMRSKSHAKAAKRSTSVSIASEILRIQRPRDTASKKMARSGSSNTAKKVFNHQEGGEGNELRGRPDE